MFCQVLAKSAATLEDVSATQVSVSLATPDGFFDYLELELILLSTDANKYFVNPNISRPQCQIGTPIKRGPLSKEAIKDPILIPNLCPLGFWNVTVRTVRANFTSVEQLSKYRNGNNNK